MREEGGRRGESMGQGEKYLHVWMNAGLCVICVQYLVRLCAVACMFVSGRVGTSNYRSTTNGDPLLWSTLSNLILACDLILTLTTKPHPSSVLQNYLSSFCVFFASLFMQGHLNVRVESLPQAQQDR